MVYPGVVEQDVDLAKAGQGLIDCLATIISEAHIGANKQGFAAIRDNGLDKLLATLGAAPGKSDRRPFACEALCSGAADPGGPSGYQGYLSFQPHILTLLI
jgi:hypothetical protein